MSSRVFNLMGGGPGLDPLPRLCATTERLKQSMESRLAAMDTRTEGLLEDMLAAAAETEHAIALQRARIRYLEGLSVTDELTGILNRRGFDAELSRALARARRQGETGMVLVVDLDRFKEINDTYGHLAGDRVLGGVADLLRAHTRHSDYVARLGGDEFAVLLTHSAPDKAARRCRGLKTRLNSLTIPWNDREIRISASFGLAPYDTNSHPETLLFLADRALYRNKGVRHPVLALAEPAMS